MGSMDDLFKDIAGAGDLNSYNKLAVGTHVLVIKDFEVKEQRTKVPFIATTFAVESSNTERSGALGDDAWFVRSEGDKGDYERKRARAFAQSVLAGIGGDPASEDQIKQVLNWCHDPKKLARGVAVKCTVTQVMENGNPKLSAKGNAIYDRKYESVTQTQDDIVRRRAWLQTAPAPVATASSPTPPAAPVAIPAAAPAFNLSSILPQ